MTFCTFGYAQSFGVYEDLYVLAGASTPSNVAWIGSFQLFMVFAMGLPAGKLFDAGYFHHIQIAGALLFVFSCVYYLRTEPYELMTLIHNRLFMLSLVDISKYYQIFLSQGVGVGIGCGLMFLPALSIQAHHWKKRRALAMGIVLTGSSFGGIIHPIMHNQLFHRKTGFAWGVRASAFLILGLLVIANCLMTTRLPSRQGPKPNFGAIFRDVPYMIASLAVFFVLWGLYFPCEYLLFRKRLNVNEVLSDFYLQLFVDLHGLSRTLAFYTLAIMNAASVFGRTIPNLLADHFGKFNVFVPICFMTGVLIWAMFGIANTAGVIVFSILYGFASGACESYSDLYQK